MVEGNGSEKINIKLKKKTVKSRRMENKNHLYSEE
jgi:hypothetical protein